MADHGDANFIARIIEELIYTEGLYCHSLHYLADLYLAPALKIGCITPQDCEIIHRLKKTHDLCLKLSYTLIKLVKDCTLS